MFTRKNLFVMVVALLLMGSLAACMAGGIAMPDREVTISSEAAMDGLTAISAGMGTGQAELTESQFSSLVTMLLKQNPNPQLPIESVTALFDPDKMYMNIKLSQNMGGIDSLTVSGNIIVKDHMVMVDLAEAAAGPLMADEGLVNLIGERLTAALNDPALGTIVDVSIGEGTIALAMSP
jgi:predicted small lipoprotein YifL